MISIIGYVTETHGKKGFTIKITEDDVTDEKGKHPEVSKEVMITVNQLHYPHDSFYQKLSRNDPRQEHINRCISISQELEKGDRVECSVYLVDDSINTNTNSYTINSNPNDILTYTRFNLWLYPSPDSFKRLEVDTPQTLKFRKQNYYMDRNREKGEKITGDSSYQYKRKWWIKENPKIIFPLFVGIWIKTKVSNIWVRVTDQNNLNKSLAIVTIISIVINIILVIITLKKG